MGSVRRFQNLMLFKHGQRPSKTGVEFGRQSHEMHGGRCAKGEKSGENCHEPQCRHTSEQAHERRDHQQGGADFFDATGGSYQSSTPFQRRIARMVLNGVADFMRCDRDRGEGVAIVLIRRQANGLGSRIVVVANFSRLDDDALESVLVQQMPCKAGTGTGVSVLRLAVFLEHALHPDSRTQNHGEYKSN